MKKGHQITLGTIIGAILLVGLAWLIVRYQKDKQTAQTAALKSQATANTAAAITPSPYNLNTVGTPGNVAVNPNTESPSAWNWTDLAIW